MKRGVPGCGWVRRNPVLFRGRKVEQRRKWGGFPDGEAGCKRQIRRGPSLILHVHELHAHERGDRETTAHPKTGDPAIIPYY